MVAPSLLIDTVHKLELLVKTFWSHLGCAPFLSTSTVSVDDLLLNSRLYLRFQSSVLSSSGQLGYRKLRGKVGKHSAGELH